MHPQAETTPHPHHRFADTRWSLVRIAHGDPDDASQQALLELCLRYWYPVYAYLRHCGHAPTPAQDIAHAFFEDLLQARATPAITQAQGRFRDYLVDALHRFLARDWRTTTEVAALVELGDVPSIQAMEARHRSEPTALGPEQAFQRSYALEVLAHTHRRLRSEARQAGREPMFDALVAHLARDPLPGQYETMARELQTRPVVLALALKRLRQRFHELADDELAQTVSDEAALAHERATLFAALQS